MTRIKEGFKGERLLSLPEDILKKYSEHPLVETLFLRKMGYFPKVKYHYVQKDSGVDYHMLIYCVAGKGHYSINGGQVHTLNENQYIILPNNTPYRFWADDDDPWTIYWLHFKGTQAGQFVHYPIVPHSILAGPTSRIQDRLDLFEEVYSCFSMAYMLDYMIHTSMCVSHLISSFVYLEQYRCFKVVQHDEQTFSAQVIHYMQENVSNNLTLNEFAQYFKYSPSHFSALFQKETGYSPINYYLQLKIRCACQYIERTNLKFMEIAEMVGFGEPAYFTRIFTKIMGISPSAYRKRETGVRL
ncbi:MAG: AraC family transcriptional regulator [Muribaculaceae bacterium]